MSEPKQTWAIEDHLCRSCGGRILRCVKGNGMTPGGNPLYKCADCGKITSAMSPSCLCWCGQSFRNNTHLSEYMCVAFSEIEKHPELKQAFLSCGWDPKRGEVGVIIKEKLRAVELV